MFNDSVLMSIKKFMKIFKFVLIFSGFMGIGFTCQSQNLALYKRYILSVPPNYPYSANPSDKSLLTDGIYSKGRFWTQSTTDGWQLEGVTITIDLEKIQPVKEVTFSTIRNLAANISFPQNIFVFISKDDKNFNYVGDAADTPDNLPGNTKMKKFKLTGINRLAKYITLSIIPQGNYIFCDEIEVLKAETFSTSKMNLIFVDSFKNVIDSLRNPKHNRRNLLRAVESFQNIPKTNRTSLSMHLSSVVSELTNKNMSENDLAVIKKNLEKEHALYLRNKFNTPFIVERYNPWDSLSELHLPHSNLINLNDQFLITTGSSQYGSFVITNSNSTPQEFSFIISNNQRITNIKLFKAVYVPSIYYSLIPDALVKTDKVTIGPGLSEMFLFKITGINSGTDHSRITISSSQKKAEFNIQAHIVSIDKRNKIENLNVNVWAYLNNIMLRNQIPEAVEDLEAHRVNTIVIPPSIVPNITTTDFTNFRSYLSNFRNVGNILLYMDYSSSDRRKILKNGQFMSVEWKNKFIVWYHNMKQLILENGFSNAEIYLYPYDEVSEGNIEDFKKLILWAKQTIPGAKFYATLNTEIAIDSVLPLIDIAQILPSLATNKLPFHHCEIWIYTGNTPSRALSPYEFYRLMAWNAFVNNYNGIGFWNYADERNGNKLNLISDQIPNFRGSYSVIYNGSQGDIISSRRWEAFLLGIEDYSILNLYATNFGIDKAKALANDVLSNSSDFNKADAVRNEMITKLTWIK